MGMLVDTCRRFQSGLYMSIFELLTTIILWWVTPISLYFAVGWELHLRRIAATLCFTLFGLFRLFSLTRHTTTLPEVLFGIAHCPPHRAELITSVTWNALLQFCSALLWTPLSWLSRRLNTDSANVFLKYLKLAVLVPVQILRALFYSLAALLVGILWLATSIGAPLFNVFILPFAILICLIAIWLIFLYFILDPSNLPPWSRVPLIESASLLRTTLSPRHALQVAGRVFAGAGYFGCRDRWFRRAALQAGIRKAVIATLPGLIGPIDTDQDDISDAVSAVRGLSNKWNNLREKEGLLDDSQTLVYTLSYKHMPVWEDGKMIRLSEERATTILRMILRAAREHGYEQVILWCDGASAAGVRIERSWVDIGLLPYVLFRTVRIETYAGGEVLTKNRLWLELERSLSELTLGMDVIEERLEEGGTAWKMKEVVEGRGHNAMGAVMHVCAQLTQGVYGESAVSREEDRTEIRAWARRLVRRSGVREMNEELGWSEEPVADRRAKAVLMRMTTLRQRGQEKESVGDVAWLGHGNEVEEEWMGGRTEFWLRLMGFEMEEIGELEHEEMEWFSVKFVEAESGQWEMAVVNLQGDYFVSMTALRNVRVKQGRQLLEGLDYGLSMTSRLLRGREGGWWLLTNSQKEKRGDLKDWGMEIVEEMFKVMFGIKCELREVEYDHHVPKQNENDTPAAWFSTLLGLAGKWQSEIAARLGQSQHAQ